MRTQSWCWACELCGHIWLAVGIEPPEKCAKCKKRGWHTKGSSDHIASPAPAQAEPKAAPIPAPAKVSMDALRAICAGNLPTPAPIIDESEIEDNTPSCSECSHRMTGKLFKDRGMVYACTDLSCPMYGLERVQR